jgi:hypothetical protein
MTRQGERTPEWNKALGALDGDGGAEVWPGTTMSRKVQGPKVHMQRATEESVCVNRIVPSWGFGIEAELRALFWK